MLAEEKEKCFEHVPYSDLKDGVLETWDGSLVGGFNILPIDVECSDETQLAEVGSKLSDLINAFSTEFQYQFISRNIIADGDSSRSFSVWIQTIPHKISMSSLLKTKLALDSLEQAEKMNRSKLKSGLERLRMALEISGLRPKILSSEDIFEELGGFFRPSEKWKFSQLTSLRQADLIIKENNFHYDHTFWGGVSILDLPDQMSPGQMANLNLSNYNSFICTKLVPKETDKIISSLKRTRNVSSALANTKTRLRDLESEAKLQSENDLLEHLIVGQEKVFDCQVSIFYSTLDQTTQDAASMETSDCLRSMGFQPYREAASLYPVFQSCLPGLMAERNRTFLLPSFCVQSLLPVYDVDKGHEKPAIKFRNRFNSDVGIDLWDSSLASYNAVISGTSGSGKSFLSNVLLKRLSDSGEISTFIIDIGASYKRLTELQGGQYFTFDLNGKNGFNPLGQVSLRDPSSLEAAVDIIAAIIGDPKHGIAKYERNVLLQEVSSILAKEPTALTLSTLRNAWLNSDSIFLKNAAIILYGWTEDRAYGRLLDNNNSLNAESNWVCFDLRGLNDHVELQRVLMLAIVKRLWEVVRCKEGKKILLLDEVWALIQNHAGFIGEAFRTFRKHNASAIAVTQSIEDLATESLTSAVLNNTPTKIILKQSLRPERLQSLLSLNTRELEIVGSLRSIKSRYSEFFMINGDKKRFLRLEPTAEDYWLATTNPQDIEFINKFKSSRLELNELQACKEIAKLYGKERP
jgi:type IV secretory pathway VirB4 component